MVKTPNKLFFLHIPKTAGSTINEHFSSALQPYLTHIESNREDSYQKIDTTDSLFLSGHIRLYEYLRYLQHDDFLTTTLLRNPFDQIVSHFNWILYICSDRCSPLFSNTPQAIRDLGSDLAKVNFGISNEVESFIESMSPIGHQLFNNCLTRYLANSPEVLHISEIQADEAISSLKHFDIIGTQNNVKLFIERISYKLGLERTYNPQRINALNNSANIQKTKKLRSALNPLINADTIVYNHVLEHFSFS